MLSGSAPFGVTVSPAVSLTFDGFGRMSSSADQTINVGPFSLTVSADSGYIQTR